jgi:hypothetical protein
VRSPKDFEESLQILEGGFVNIANRRVSFINPSIRDYLANYLADNEMLKDFALSARKPDWGNNLWKYAKELGLNNSMLMELAKNLEGTLPAMLTTKVYTPSSRSGLVEKTDLSNAARMELLLEWWEATNSAAVTNCILELARHPVGGFNSWLDCDTLVELAAKLPDEDYYEPLPNLPAVLEAIEDGIIDILNWHPTYDELDGIVNNIELYESRLSDRVLRATSKALAQHIGNIEDSIADEDSQSSLEEQINAVKKFAARAQVSSQIVEKAVKSINDKIKDLSERDIEESGSPPIMSAKTENDKFDSAAIRNLFATLISPS